MYITTTHFYCQNNYHECALLILTKFPSQLEVLLSIVMKDKVEEQKVRNLMEFISTHDSHLLSRVISLLAHSTSTAGMELLR